MYLVSDVIVRTLFPASPTLLILSLASPIFSFLTSLQNKPQQLLLQSNQDRRFAQESRFGFVVQNLSSFFVRTSQL